MAVASADGVAVALPARPETDPAAGAWRLPDLPPRPRRALPAVRLAAGAAPDRPRLDGLAIGAPVTAALVGVMLARGEIAGAAAGATGSDGSAIQADPSDPRGMPSPDAAPHLQAAAAAEAVEPDAARAEQIAALDPVSVGSAAPARPAEAGSLQEHEGRSPPSAAADAIDPVVVPGAAIQMNLSIANIAFDLGADAAIAGGDDLEPIGGYAGGDPTDDVISGTDLADHLEGGAGNDVIHGLAGGDQLAGGTGDDQLFGGAGTDSLLGGTGQDALDGGADDDLLFGGGGSDTLFGDMGGDQLDGGEGNDSLDGGVGADRLSGGSGDDLLIVDDRNDRALERALGQDGGGADVLQVEGGFTGEAATFAFGEDLDTALPEGTAGDRRQVDPEIENLILKGSVNHDAVGDDHDNSLIGNAGDNALYGGGGADSLSGGDGLDLLDGGLGDDELQGGIGNDILSGSFGADRLSGGVGDDLLEGGHEADLLYGEAGDDTFVIGLDDNAVDTVFDHEGANRIVLEGVTDETVEGSIVGDDLYLVVDHNPVAVVSGYVGNEESLAGVEFGGGIVAVEDLLAETTGGASLTEPASGSEADADPLGDLLAPYLPGPSLTGAGAADHLAGSSGADWLSGLAGDDDLHGAAGADVLEGGAGSDLLHGDAGDDRYLFDSGQSGLDTIRDAEGANVAELHGFTGAQLEGVVVGQDLFVVADHAPVFKVESYVGNEASFAGVQVDDTFVPTEELFG